MTPLRRPDARPLHVRWLALNSELSAIGEPPACGGEMRDALYVRRLPVDAAAMLIVAERKMERTP